MQRQFAFILFTLVKSISLPDSGLLFYLRFYIVNYLISADICQHAWSALRSSAQRLSRPWGGLLSLELSTQNAVAEKAGSNWMVCLSDLNNLSPSFTPNCAAQALLVWISSPLTYGLNVSLEDPFSRIRHSLKKLKSDRARASIIFFILQASP